LCDRFRHGDVAANLTSDRNRALAIDNSFGDVRRKTNRLNVRSQRLERPIFQEERIVLTTDSGLKYEDVSEGIGPGAKSGDTVEVHYTGWLTDGKKFDSSHDRKQTFAFKLGAGKVIKGWDEGVAGMKTGGKRKLTIPPALGYGARGAGNVIPANAELVFEVDLVKIR
jgi:FKBP-type peptidyl-prolyl cis-trans isomerase FkpA